MSIDVTCSGCGSKYQVPDSFAGRRAQCKQCSGVMHIPAAESAGDDLPRLAADDAPADSAASLTDMLDEELKVVVDATDPKCPSCGTDLAAGATICVDCGLNLQTGQRVNEPVDPPKMRASPMAMSKTATGLGILFWGLVVQLSVIGLAVILPLFIRIAGVLFSWGGIALLTVILAAGMIAFCLATIACVVGKCFCLTVPSQAVNKVILVLAIVLELQCALVIMGSLVVSDMSAMVTAFSSLAAFVAVIPFLVFVKQLAWYVGRRDLGDDAMAIIYQCIALACIFIGCIVMAIVAPLIAAAIEAWLLLILLSLLLLATIIGILIYAFIIFYRYVKLIGELALAVRTSRRT